VTPPKTAIIRMTPYSKSIQFLFQSKIAGISPFKRLIFSLQRAGIDNFIIFQKNTPRANQHKIEKDIQNDSRFNSHFEWNVLGEEIFQEDLGSINLLSNYEKVLLVEGDLVTTAPLIKEFINSACSLNTEEVAGLISESKHSDGIYLITRSDVEDFLRFGSFNREITTVSLLGPWLYRQRIKNLESIQLVEKKILNEHKIHYRQFMDTWFNSLFSIPISSLLVKTFLTPNQVTVLGLFIGMASGFFFAQGNYWSGIIGSLLLVTTAIWDCCDGDVARLKFMESEFGEKLDTICDNTINIFIFTGIMLGVAHSNGLAQAITPFLLLSLGGSWIFYLTYFPKGGKGYFFKNTSVYDVIQALASRNFIYVIFIFGVLGKLDWFLWLAGIGSNIFALYIYQAKKKIIHSTFDKSLK
jgi:phosphatidylglycerophosphate synthase